MTTPVDRAPVQQLQAAPEAVGAAASKSTPAARWVLGLLTACTAIALAVSGPPPGLDKHAYFLALSAAFFAGVAGVMSAVWVSDDPSGRRAAASSRLVVYSSVAALAVAVGLSVASLLLW
uniref:Uncharacterized protein n=1 Tax=Setaria viridis TaxID=4556 RepID=A0A4U6UBV6_SETVI|nr:hypothetical protein SEVIR_5G099350v2 [Setaria viridis]